MVQDQSSTMNASQQSQWSCRPSCGDWGKKEYNTVNIDAAALNGPGKENAAHPNTVNGAGGKANATAIEEQEKMRRLQEAKEEEIRRAEEKRREMERRVKEEQERQQAELRRREAERRRLQLEQEAREREELERLQREHAQKEEQLRLEEQRREEARRLQEIEDQKKILSWLRANGFQNPTDLVRKKLSKVAPLQVAVQQNNVEMLKLLIAAGADASKVNGKNESALTVAQKLDKKGSHAAVVEALTSLAK